MPTTSLLSKSLRKTAYAVALAVLTMGVALAASPVSASQGQDAMPEGMNHDSMGHADMAAPSADDLDIEHETMEGVGENVGMDHDAMQGAVMDHDHDAMMAEAEEQGVKVGITEHLGEFIPLDAKFVTSEGKHVTLGEVIDAPTIILPVYYTCPNVCHILQSAVARVLPEVAVKPGEELKILSISFDENDNAKGAARIKRNFAAALRGGFPPEYWTFLAGDKKEIDRTMKAIGFGFERMGKDFAHPVIVVAVSPKGKIVRYLYGSDFLPFDITMAATEAAKGTPGISVKRLLSFCYSYDPQGRRYAFDILRVSGITVLVTLAMILGILFLSGKKKRR